MGTGRGGLSLCCPAPWAEALARSCTAVTPGSPVLGSWRLRSGLIGLISSSSPQGERPRAVAQLPVPPALCTALRGSGTPAWGLFSTGHRCPQVSRMREGDLRVRVRAVAEPRPRRVKPGRPGDLSPLDVDFTAAQAPLSGSWDRVPHAARQPAGSLCETLALLAPPSAPPLLCALSVSL